MTLRIVAAAIGILSIPVQSGQGAQPSSFRNLLFGDEPLTQASDDAVDHQDVLQDSSVQVSEGEGWTFSIGAGVNFIPDVDIDDVMPDDGIGFTGASVEFDAGLSLNFSFATQLDTNNRFQFDIGYLTNDPNSVSGSVVERTGGATTDTLVDGTLLLTGVVDTTQVPIMATLIHDFSDAAEDTNFHPYIGIGAGLVFWELEISAINYEYSETCFGYQFLAGFDWEWSPTTGAYVQYTLMGSTPDGYDTIMNHSISAGMSFKF